jgi:hypothetical protein
VRALETLFAGMEKLSLGHWLSIGANTRSLASTAEGPTIEGMDEHLLWRLRAASIIDWYIVGFLAVECGCYAAGLGRVPAILLVLIGGYRLLEIVQLFANAVLFEQRRPR